ncbi:MAG: hypothetical protein LJE83_13765 [Gammaproteobacteria bacterium]|jgi:CheY-like chemotaxis protein|nr:hypothetical protein [Gammaproteobacteria bacterium]
MPGDMNGYELADRASSEFPDIKILLATARLSLKINRLKKKIQLLEKPCTKSELIRSFFSCMN